MSRILDFYDNLDLKYIEIGIAMEKIDRTNPGKIPFIIPVLTPDLDNSSMKESKIAQKSKTNIVNENPGAVDVSDIQTSNYIYIEIPKELCTLIECEYKVEGTVNLEGTSIDPTLVNTEGPTSEHWANTSGEIYAIVNLKDGLVKKDSKLKLIPTDEYRYINKGSKWAICFLGGDINRPTVLARLP